jgi:uroporphyrinogen decarboxylase
MTSRELVRRTVEFDKPARIPRQTWILPWAEEHHPDAVARLRTEFPDDVQAAPQVYHTPPRLTGSRYAKGRYIDEWGCRFDNIHGGVIGTVLQPLISDWAQLDTFRTPDEVLNIDADVINRFCRATDRFVLAGNLVRPFERLGFIRTMEQAMIDLVEQRPEFIELLRRIHEHYLREVEAWGRTDVDAIMIMDDWGAQTSMLVHPRLFRQFFLPMYQDYVAIARRCGKYVFMHSDGNILGIFEDLIGAGVQAINSQVPCMGAAELGKRFRGRITFWGEFDRQELLARGTTAQTAAAVREFREHLYADGGVIAQCEFGLGAVPENVMQVFRTFQELDGESR